MKRRQTGDAVEGLTIKVCGDIDCYKLSLPTLSTTLSSLDTALPNPARFNVYLFGL